MISLFIEQLSEIYKLEENIINSKQQNIEWQSDSQTISACRDNGGNVLN